MKPFTCLRSKISLFLTVLRASRNGEGINNAWSAKKNSSRSRSLTASDTKALLLRAEALLGKKKKRNILIMDNGIQDELRNF